MQLSSIIKNNTVTVLFTGDNMMFDRLTVRTYQLQQKALQPRLLELEGIKIIRFDGTPDGWGHDYGSGKLCGYVSRHRDPACRYAQGLQVN